MRSTRNHDGAGDADEEQALNQPAEKKPRSVAFGNLPPPLKIPTTSDSNRTPNLSSWQSPTEWAPVENNLVKPLTPDLRNLNSPWYNEKAEASSGMDYFSMAPSPTEESSSPTPHVPASAPNRTPVVPLSPTYPLSLPTSPAGRPATPGKSALKLPKLALPTLSLPDTGKHVTLPESSDRRSDRSISRASNEISKGKPSSELQDSDTHSHHSSSPKQPKALASEYTEYYRAAPAKTYWQTLRPFSGRLCQDNWLRVAFRPFVLYAYPAILWSSVVYSLSVGWLIVLSESVSSVYKNSESYNFTSLQTGLVYISPFIGGILGTAVAGKVSDLIVRFMSRRNGGIYEPEYRLVMAIPIALTTAIGLMGFGWSAQERDNWIVPTVFFGIISFGCSLGSTTAITFAVDSYRVYAGEALVTLNFSKSECFLLSNFWQMLTV